jgi:hypothetical protein
MGKKVVTVVSSILGALDAMFSLVSKRTTTALMIPVSTSQKSWVIIMPGLHRKISEVSKAAAKHFLELGEGNL